MFKKHFVPLTTQKSLKTLSMTIQSLNVILITQPNDTAEKKNGIERAENTTEVRVWQMRYTEPVKRARLGGENTAARAENRR